MYNTNIFVHLQMYYDKALQFTADFLQLLHVSREIIAISLIHERMKSAAAFPSFQRIFAWRNSGGDEKHEGRTRCDYSWTRAW